MTIKRDGSNFLSLNSFAGFKFYDTQNSSERMRINGSGNVGIGTTSPGNKLTISGPSSNQFEIINSANNKSWRPNVNGTSFYITESGVSNPFVIQAGGNIGIGTTSPSEKLDVVGRVRGERFRTTTGGSASFAAYYFLGDSDTGTFQPTNNTFCITTAGSERMRITSTGNVGIGTTSPGSKLEVNGTVNINNSGDRVFIADPGQGTFSLGDLDALSSEAQIVGTGVDLLFKNDDTTTMVATYNNRVGIGTTSPASKLEVDGGDIEVDDSASGLILRSPDGTRYRVTVANGGTLTVTAV